MFKPGRNCWKVFDSSAGTFLVDGENYFRDLYESLPLARNLIFIAGWDMDSRIRLVCKRKGQYPIRLAEFLDQLTRDRPDLNVYLLDWDFSTVFSAQREILPSLKFGWKTGERVRFKLDGTHPVGATHHQKLVIMDDRVAWCGGIDITGYRWDTREHRKGDRRRKTPSGVHYGPYHDVMVRVEGQVVTSLGELFRSRWRNATGEEIPDMPAGGGLEPDQKLTWDFTRARTAIARTIPAYKGRQEIREVEQMYVDLIDAARTSIYIENQYFTSAKIGERILDSLRSPEGPEIVIVQGREYSGWLGERVMGILRSDLAGKMEAADLNSRLRICYPETPITEKEVFTLHSKCMIVDDRYVRIGSSNLNNRSMGLDTECDLVFDAGDDTELRSRFRRFRADLLSEHLGLKPEDVLTRFEGGERMLEIIDERRGARKNLARLESEDPGPIMKKIGKIELLDPEKPLEEEKLAEMFLGDEARDEKTEGRGPLPFLFLLLLLAVGIPLLWNITPLGDWLSQEKIADLLQWMQQSPWSLILVPGVYLAGTLLFVPLNLIIIATATVFGPCLSAFYVITGSLLGAVAGYGVGGILGRGRVEKLMPAKFGSAVKKISRKGLLPILVVRIFPVAPNTFINFMAGAVRIPFRDYILGTFIGILPGGLSLVFFQRGLVRFVSDPGLKQGALMAGLLVLIALLYLALQHRYGGGEKAGHNKVSGRAYKSP
jgi:phosphatidylserine/phosphatidylglycerophosphate/cardiolipin synthase-like enzyme/uncharacterized membrane protein YdjX (TVP38/TMEM64 family)